MIKTKHFCLTCWGDALEVGARCSRCGTVLTQEDVNKLMLTVVERERGAYCSDIKLNNIANSLVVPGIYRHYKGNLYEVVGLGTDTEDTTKQRVWYKKLKSTESWDRPLEDWLSEPPPNLLQRDRFMRLPSVGDLVLIDGKKKKVYYCYYKILDDNKLKAIIWTNHFFGYSEQSGCNLSETEVTIIKTT